MTKTLIHEPMICITGASSGLGRALALAYAERGRHLLLISRDKEALHETMAMCQQKGVTVICLIQDLGAFDAVDKLYAQIQKQKIRINMLINNAGLGGYGNFASQEEDKIHELLMVNTLNLVALTRRLLPQMLQEKGSAIVNISSVFAYVSVPKQVLYSASKAFLKTFSLGLAEELKGKDLSVTCVCLGMTTDTKFRPRMGLSIKAAWCSATTKEVVPIIISAIERRKILIIPFWYNKIMVHLMQCVPSVWMPKVVSFAAYRLRKVESTPKD